MKKADGILIYIICDYKSQFIEHILNFTVRRGTIPIIFSEIIPRANI